MENDLRLKVENFIETVRECARLYKTGDRAARALAELYAAKSASALLAQVRALSPDDVKIAYHRTPVPKANVQEVFRHPKIVQDCALQLIDAVSSHDRTAIETTLEKIGVFAFFLPDDQQFDRLEFIVGCVLGRARIVPLIELAIFAVERAAYHRINKYVADAELLLPGPAELHDLYTVTGSLAFYSYDFELAGEYLLESARVCQTACLACGIRPFNISLAEKLLGKSEKQGVVVSYLTHCQSVWSHQKEQIAIWIEAIQAGKNPELGSCGYIRVLNSPKVKLKELLIRASLPSQISDPTFSRGESLEGREERIAKYRLRGLSAIKGKLNMGRN